MEYLNEKTVISFPIDEPTVMEASYFDSEKRIFFVKESRDGGKEWIITA